jgi:hypothetical protein
MFEFLLSDDTKKCATSLGLQVQSVIARVNFPHGRTRGLYKTLGNSRKSSLRSRRATSKQSPCLTSPTPPNGCQAQGVECK